MHSSELKKIQPCPRKVSAQDRWPWRTV